ncbi:MAG: RNA polymerase sigma factor [Gemmatimonadaceae bacterium]
MPDPAAPATKEGLAPDARFAAEALCWLPDITRFARSLAGNASDGDDLVQETFLRAYRFWGSYTPGTDARRWLITICRNVFRTRLSREAVVQSVGDEADLDVFATVVSHHAARDDGVDHLFEQGELGTAIEAAIARLPEVYQVTVKLIDVEGMAYEDVAAILDVPLGTVRSRLFRARRLLQEDLLEHARDAGFKSIASVRAKTDTTQETTDSR